MSDYSQYFVRPPFLSRECNIFANKSGNAITIQIINTGEIEMIKHIFLSTITLVSGISLNADSQLNYLIPPEIKNDAFYNVIYRLAQDASISTILEIGSSSGDGSTEAFVTAIEKNLNRPTLFCMEISKPRFEALQKRYGHTSHVRCYNVSSVPLEVFPLEQELITFMQTTPTNLNMYGITTVLGWLRQDIEYVQSSNVPQNGVEIIKKENSIEHFDMVLIDGSEFTGMAEFKLIYGARYILLDDINAFKNYANYQQLLSDPAYELLEKNKTLRNGYAVFKKK